MTTRHLRRCCSLLLPFIGAHPLSLLQFGQQSVVVGHGVAICFIVVIVVCTSMHDTAHGATLKHFGGEVHDSGLMLMFFTPCMYCNVSDAWLLPDK
jgi:hypothetical protein